MELPNTALGIVPLKFPAVRLVKFAPEPLNPVAVKTPVDGTYFRFVALTDSVVKFPAWALAN